VDQSSYNVLTAEDLQQTTENTVWDAIRRLRPQWLRTRGRTSLTGQSPDEPAVYVGGTRYGALRDLRQMQVFQVTRVRFIEPIEATTLFGTGHTGGAIMIDLGPNP
jgi:hypothetical protein